MNKPKKDYRKEFDSQEAWGLHTLMDIHHCDPDLIRDAKAIREFVIKLCHLIEMKRFKDPVIVHFGKDKKVEGFSMTQLIETSLISAHFANQTGHVYLDVFSCKYYDPQLVIDFAKEFFKARDCFAQIILRK